MTLDAQIESILFSKGEPVSAGDLGEILGKKTEEVEEALKALEARLLTGGIRLVRNKDLVILATSPEMGELLEKLRKEELNKNLGRASLETLTIILYESPVSKSEIDYIRGVNSGFILRTLLVRGLIEREVNPKDKRTFLYSPTLDLLSYMGVPHVSKLPEYGKIREEVDQFKKEFVLGEAVEEAAPKEITPPQETA